MELSDVRLQLQRSSRRAGIMTLVGVLVVVGALFISLYYLISYKNKLDKEIADREKTVADLERKIEERKNQLKEVENTFSNFTDVVKEKDPELANDAVSEAIKKDPGANKLLLEVLSRRGVRPPPHSRVAFVKTRSQDLIFREGPHQNAKELFRLKKGETFYVVEYTPDYEMINNKRGRWAHIQTPEGKQAWVFEGYIGLSK